MSIKSLNGVRYATILDPDRHSTLKVLYAIPLPLDYWGVFTVFRASSWGAQIPTVTGEALSHALHGRPKPLREQLGRPPQIRARMIPALDRLCRDAHPNLCSSVTPLCIPGSGQLPACYEAPVHLQEFRELATIIGRAWDEGRYVFVVEGSEFVVT